MAEVLISNLQLLINDVTIAYVPNTLKFVGNTAETKVTAITTGGRGSSSVHSTDTSEAYSKVMVEVRATKQVIDLVDVWYDNIGGNVIELSSRNGDVAKAFTGMSLVKKPEFDFGADKSFELEFQGDAI